MKTSGSFVANKRLAGLICLLAALGTVAAGFNQAGAYERKVLFEDFTATDCPPCATAAPAVEAALEDVGDEHVAAVAVHLTVGGTPDPWWMDNQEDASIRASYYDVRTVPSFFIDGTRYDGARTRDGIRSAIESRGRIDSPLEMALAAQLVNDELRIQVTITSEEEFDDVRLYLALTEEYYRYQGVNNWWDHYDAMVKMIPDGDGTRFEINAEESQDFDFNQDMNGLGWHELEADNLILVAWVQDSDDEVHQVQNYFLGYDQPMVIIEEWEVLDRAGGDGDGRPEPGETADFVITLLNAPRYLDAETVEVRLSTADEGIEIVNGLFEVEGLAGGERASNEENPLRFRVDEDFEAHPVTFELTVTAQPGEYEDVEEIAFMVDWPPFVIVDASGSQQAGEAVSGLFGTEGLPYADRLVHFYDLIDIEAIENYEVVLWHSFNNQEEILNEWDEEVLTEYLDNGGALILTGSHIASALSGRGLMRDYLGASLASDQERYTFVNGTSGDPAFDGCRLFLGGGEAVDWPDATATFNLRGGGEEVLWYEQNDQNIGVAGVGHVAETYRTLLLGFPIESIGGMVSTELRDVFMGRVWNWEEGAQGVTLPGQEVPEVFALYPAFPNPFNSRTIVSFVLSRACNITLSLYDIRGREAARLLEGMMSAGEHRVSLDADAFGLTSGIYYSRLYSGGESLGQKVLFIR